MTEPMTDRRARRVAPPDGYGDAVESAPITALTRSQAEELIRAKPSISPWRVVAAQAVAGMACVLFAYGLTRNAATAWSALYGAAAAVIPSLLLARGMTRRMSNPMAAAAGFMFWEMLKIGVTVAMLVIAAKVVPDLSWPALLATMVVCIKMNWVALLWRARRPQDEASRQHGS